MHQIFRNNYCLCYPIPQLFVAPPTCYPANDVLNIQSVVEVSLAPSGYRKLIKAVEEVSSPRCPTTNLVTG